MKRAAPRKRKKKQQKASVSGIEVRDARTENPVCRLPGTVDPEECEKCGGLLNFDDVTPPLPEWGVEQVGCTCD
jgi:hypothetical protein